MSQFFIVVGDKTDHGGEVLEGSPADTINGKMIARVGDKVWCPRCRCHATIIEGNPGVLIDGKPAAYHGALTSCGAKLIASQIDNVIGGEESSGVKIIAYGSTPNSSHDSSYSAVAFSQEEEPIDPRTGLRAGPTRENLSALGMPQSHSANAGAPTRDPLPGSIMSGDFAAQNDISLSKEQRRERVFMLMKSREKALRSAGEHYGIDPRSIAAAISWEFTENRWWGYTSDKIAPASQQDGYGWGSIHDSTLRTEMLPGISQDESIALRNNLDSSIELVGARMRQQIDTYQGLTGIDLSNNPVATTWLFNTSTESLTTSFKIQQPFISKGIEPTLNIQNDMALWTSDNLNSFQWASPTNPVADRGIRYRYTVDKTP